MKTNNYHEKSKLGETVLYMNKLSDKNTVSHRKLLVLDWNNLYNRTERKEIIIDK